LCRKGAGFPFAGCGAPGSDCDEVVLCLCPILFDLIMLDSDSFLEIDEFPSVNQEQNKVSRRKK